MSVKVELSHFELAPTFQYTALYSLYILIAIHFSPARLASEVHRLLGSPDLEKFESDLIRTLCRTTRKFNERIT
jgi:hypothetical protein